MPHRRFGFIEQIGWHVEKDEKAFLRVFSQVFFHPCHLFSGIRKCAIHDLRIEHHKMAIVLIEAIPRLPKPPMIPIQHLLTDMGSGCGGIWLIADIMISCNIVRLNVARSHLFKRFVHRFVELLYIVGIFLNHISVVHHEFRRKCRRHAQGYFSPDGLLPTVPKFERGSARIEHVVGIGDDNKFKECLWQKGFVKHRLQPRFTGLGDCLGFIQKRRTTSSPQNRGSLT